MEIQVPAYAKLNISLDVVKKLPDGYHDMRMVMETVELHDDVHISVTEGSGITIRTNLPYLPTDGRNIAVKAAELFFQELSLPPRRVVIRLNKRIPVCAGMAGGSSNAAAVLRGLNALMGTGVDRAQLERIGGKLGSDVPYCVAGGTVLARGRGDEMERLPAMPVCHIVICKPKFSVSTPALFSRLDCGKIRHRPDTDGIAEALAAGDLGEVAHRMYNVFETVLGGRRGEVEGIKSTLLDCGALGAAMTGTGPSVFGLFDSEAAASAAFHRLRGIYEETYLTKNRPELQV